jgi:hypothetical protein
MNKLFYLILAWGVLVTVAGAQVSYEAVRKVTSTTTDAIEEDLDFLAGRTLTVGSGATFTYSTGASLGGDLTELRGDLGLAIDLDVQAYSATLDTLSTLSAEMVDWLSTPNSANLAAAITDETGTGALVLATSPALTTPDLGTPSAVNLVNATNIPAGELAGMGTNVKEWLITANSSNLRAALTDEVGTGAAYFVGGALGTPASVTLTNATGLPAGGMLDEAVTNAKLAHMAQATFKGRASGAGTGDATDLSADQASAILDGATDPYVRNSDALQVGRVLQMVMVKTDSTASTAGTTYATLLTANITPRSATSTIVVEAMISWGHAHGSGYPWYGRIRRGSTDIALAPAAGNRQQTTFGGYNEQPNATHSSYVMAYDEGHDTTAVVTYNLDFATGDAGTTFYLNRSVLDRDISNEDPRAVSFIKITEYE